MDARDADDHRRGGRANGIEFSANGKPIRFGFLRGSSERFPQVHEHGIDNFRVVVKRF